uniref:Putative 5.3 kDa protein n=1 Tax=Ixodes ricinus TaxID=34613 RepID=A0A0K8RKV0_IXORI
MRALIICTLLLLHGMMSLAQMGFSSLGRSLNTPRCGGYCTRKNECPPDCKHCRKYRNTLGFTVCGKGNRF